MSNHDEEPFLARWSRLKQEQRAEEQPVKAVPAPAEQGAHGAAPVQLPLPETLTPQSDFSAFMGPQVEDALRRAALKTLFAHPQINVADPFEPYSGDWTVGEAIPKEMLARMHEARAALRPQPEAQAAPPSSEAKTDQSPLQEPESRSDDVPGRKDA
ncbi:MAG: DUF3306 domain-containing protein [Burkholderiales bacterium]